MLASLLYKTPLLIHEKAEFINHFITDSTFVCVIALSGILSMFCMFWGEALPPRGVHLCFRGSGTALGVPAVCATEGFSKAARR